MNIHDDGGQVLIMKQKTRLSYLQILVKLPTKTNKLCPGWCDSVGWASSHKVKGRWLDSQAGHTPRLQVQFLVRAHTRGNQSMFLSLSFSFHSPLSKTNENEIFLKYKLFPHYNLLTIFNKNVLTEKKNHTNYYNSKHNFLGHRSM